MCRDATKTETCQIRSYQTVVKIDATEIDVVHVDVELERGRAPNYYYIIKILGDGRCVFRSMAHK